MTRKTRNAHGRSELGVCVPHQLNHFASSLLLCFIVLLKLILYVAIGAVNAKRGLKRKHYLHQPVSRNPSKQLDVFVLLLRAFFFASSWKRVKRWKLGRRARLSGGFSA